MTVAYGVWAWWGGVKFWVSPLTRVVALTTLSHYRASVWYRLKIHAYTTNNIDPSPEPWTILRLIGSQLEVVPSITTALYKVRVCTSFKRINRITSKRQDLHRSTAPSTGSISTPSRTAYSRAKRCRSGMLALTASDETRSCALLVISQRFQCQRWPSATRCLHKVDWGELCFFRTGNHAVTDYRNHVANATLHILCNFRYICRSCTLCRFIHIRKQRSSYFNKLYTLASLHFSRIFIVTGFNRLPAFKRCTPTNFFLFQLTNDLCRSFTKIVIILFLSKADFIKRTLLFQYFVLKIEPP